MKLGGKISTSSRYIIDITERDPLYLGELGGGVIRKKLKKLGIFNLRTSHRILMKFYI